jgi:LysM repeat protein
MIRKLAIIQAVVSFLLSSCSQATIQVTPTILPTGMLTPYHTVTSSPISATSTIVVVIPVTPAPTATPFLHTITNDDTMLGIAYQYGITLEELQTANPGIDPHFLSVGKQLVIPIEGEIPALIATPRHRCN